MGALWSSLQEPRSLPQYMYEHVLMRILEQGGAETLYVTVVVSLIIRYAVHHQCGSAMILHIDPSYLRLLLSEKVCAQCMQCLGH